MRSTRQKGGNGNLLVELIPVGAACSINHLHLVSGLKGSKIGYLIYVRPKAFVAEVRVLVHEIIFLLLLQR